MRQIVDKKLQDTLNKRMTESFQLVNDRLQEVYKGLGEMKNLAQGVGDLKKVLTNVKTRGILGEIQLGSILQEILSPSQYDTNVVTKNQPEILLSTPLSYLQKTALVLTCQLTLSSPEIHTVTSWTLIMRGIKTKYQNV